jgi:hypothetical protein
METLLAEGQLQVFNLLKNGCQHLWHRGKPDQAKIEGVLKEFYPLTFQDPNFLAHLACWSLRQDMKDLKVISIYLNFLSSADGTAFDREANLFRPNLRIVSSAAVQKLDVPLTLRVLQLGKTKYEIQPGVKSTHCPVTLRTAVGKYLAYRQHLPATLAGIKAQGLRKKYLAIYRALHRRVPAEVLAAFKADTLIEKFGGTSEEIVSQIEKTAKSVPVILSMLEKSAISPLVAVALLERCTPKQVVVYQALFEELGLLAVPEVAEIFAAKAAMAGASVDRLKVKGVPATEQLKQEIQAQAHKAAVGSVGKVYLHLDVSGSMRTSIDWAKKYTAKIAAAIQDPANNLKIGTFQTIGQELPAPGGYTQAHFEKLFFGVNSFGGTMCHALWEKSRTWGADVDVFVTDQKHNDGTAESSPGYIQDLADHFAKFSRPKAVVIVNVGVHTSILRQAFERVGVPVTEILGSDLEKSQGIGEVLRTALKGSLAIVEEIMATPLVELPKWWWAV